MNPMHSVAIQANNSRRPEVLLEGDETIVLVDDFPEIVMLLQDFLAEQGLPSVVAGSAEELRRVLIERPVALVLLDIGLPDADGTLLLPELKKEYADMAVIMLTAVTDLQTALECLRQGADDYLTKPVQFTELIEMVRRVLERRRLTINNRLYQRQIEQANFRLHLLHELTMKMNSAYLSMVELDEILQAILVGITAEDGLSFNRAFLALFDDTGTLLEGRFAIGPGCAEEAGRIWHHMQEQKLTFEQIISSIKGHCFTADSTVNRIVRALCIPAADEENLLIRATKERRSINVVDGKSDYPVEPELIGLLEEDSFVVVPLYAPSKSLGVIIADHFITQQPITLDLVEALEGFASQASLAIEHCRLYMAMEHKIDELEHATQELDKNKDLLVEAERYSALGQMAA
jgi:DNA-binding response OmpR family regulator